MTAGKELPIGRFRINGLRKLNWIERSGADYADHLVASGFDRWIETGPLAIVVGPNAGGKSTIIDFLRGLAIATLWPGLARENYGGDDFSGFDVEGDGFALSARFSKWTPRIEDTYEKLTIFAVAQRDGSGDTVQCLAPKFPSADAWSGSLQLLLDTYVCVKVHYWPATGRLPGSEIDDVTLVDLLNELSGHFPSVLANPKVKPFAIFKGLGAPTGRIGVLFKDDAGQHSFVHRDALPLGWLQLVSVLHALRGCEPGSLVLLDEPDRHLHPSLQRVLVEMIAKERDRLQAQVVLATHSSVLVNPELCARVGARVIVAARGRCEVLTDARHVLDDLGVTSGDLVQANGVIWAEGPSDRIYLKRWLELYAAHAGAPVPIERVHYAFVSYGGALLKHIGLSEAAIDRVDLRSVNRNFSVVIDRDLTPMDEEVLAGDKGRLLREAATLVAESAIWVTEPYTIEAYLPDDWPPVQRYVARDAQGRVRVAGIGKVELARRFAGEAMAWEASYRVGSDLAKRIAALFERIKAWQSPQEIIVPTYLPPFLIEMPHMPTEV